jgi:hypothetical protein
MQSVIRSLQPEISAPRPSGRVASRLTAGGLDLNQGTLDAWALRTSHHRVRKPTPPADFFQAADQGSTSSLSSSLPSAVSVSSSSSSSAKPLM